MKFKVTKYYEAYEEYTVDAENADAAEDKVFDGTLEPDEVIVKGSEILSCELVKE